MNEGEPKAVTELLKRINKGDISAKDQLFHVLYPKLRSLAESAMRGERRTHTLQPTALVNEAAVKLINCKFLQEAENRIAFLAAAGRAMHEVLIDHARARAAQKRPTGAGRDRVPLDDVVDCFEESHRLNLLALDDALQELRTFDQRKHDIVTLHFFGGLKFKEIANHLQVSLSTIEKDWLFARTWLQRTIDSV